MHEVANDGPGVAAQPGRRGSVRAGRGRGLWDVLARWETIHLGKRLQPGRFARAKLWLVSESYANRLYLYPLGLARPSIPGLFRTNVFALIRSHLLDGARRPVLPTTASAIQVSEDAERIRLFYLERESQPLSVKIVSKESARAVHARAEVELRRRIESLGTIAVPKITDVEETDRQVCIVEEFVNGRRFSARRDSGILAEQILPQLLATYRALGLCDEPIGRFLPADLTVTLGPLLAGRREGEALLGRLAPLIEADPAVPSGLCHGDLLPSNLALSGGRAYVLDWGRAKSGPVAFDLLRLAAKYPKRPDLTRAVRDAYEAAFPDRACGLGDLITAYAAARIAANPGHAGRHLAYWARYGR